MLTGNSKQPQKLRQLILVRWIALLLSNPLAANLFVRFSAGYADASLLSIDPVDDFLAVRCA